MENIKSLKFLTKLQELAKLMFYKIKNNLFLSMSSNKTKQKRFFSSFMCIPLN